LNARGCTILLATLVASALPAGIASAANIKVTTHSDEFGSGGKCALREAIQAANNDSKFGGCSKGHDNDTIVLGKGIYKLSIEVDDSTDNTNEEGDLDVVSNMAIEGKSAKKTIIDGNSQQLDERILHQTEGNLSIKGVTLRNGWSVDDGDARGGAVWNEGGKKLTIRGARIVDNYSYYSGGGIAVTDGATLDISNSLVADNGVDDYGGGITSYDGGGAMKISHTKILGNTADNGAAVIVGDGKLTLDHSVIANNFGVDYGGGIDLYGNGATIRSSTIADNVSLEYGGGIYDESNQGPVLIENSTISGNRAALDGGGIYADEPQPWTIRNSTISGNQALADDTSSGYGGAIGNYGAEMNLQSVTITKNSAYDAAGIYAGGGTTRIRNSIVAGNRDYGSDAAIEDCYDNTGLSSDGHNLFGDDTCQAIGSDFHGTSTAPLSAHVAQLAANGGPTQTHALEAGSPAINNAANCPKTDQRGHKRKGKCDIGAYER
jgi:CSLREA domain-containing protein